MKPEARSTRALIRELINAANSLHDGRPLNQRIVELCRKSAEFLGCDRVSVMVWDGDHFRARHNWGNPPDIAAQFPRYKVPKHAPLMVRLFDEGNEFVVVNEAKTDPALAEIAAAARIESIVVASMHDHDRQPLGFMTAEYNERIGQFSAQEAEVVLGAARLAQGALLVDREWQSRMRLAGELHAVIDDERRRLGRDLHDDPLQRIFAVGAKLEALRATIADPGVDEVLAQIIDDCSAATCALRDIAVETHPVTASGDSIGQSLDRLTSRRSADGGWSYELRCHDVEGTTATNAVLLLRIADQALVNVNRHAQASKVEIELAGTIDGVALTISDDGVGFRSVPSRRLGIVSMREHAADIGGRLDVESEPGSGTRVRLWLPQPFSSGGSSTTGRSQRSGRETIS